MLIKRIRFLGPILTVSTVFACGEDNTQRIASLPGVPEPVDVASIVAVIGMVDGPEEYVFGDISSIAVDAERNVYVTDLQGPSIRAYDENGDFLRVVGRSGQGPGEYSRPTHMAVSPEGGLYIRDNHRLTVLTKPEDDSLVWADVESSWQHGWPSAWREARSRVDSLGRYFDPRSLVYVDGQDPKYFYVIGDSAYSDTLSVPLYRNLGNKSFAGYLVGSGSGRVTAGLSHAPFEAVPAWDVTPKGTLIGGEGDQYILYETTAEGDTVGVIHGVRRRRAVPADERADSAAAFDERIEALPVAVNELFGASDMVIGGELPDTLPAFIAVDVTRDGDIWVELWPRQAGTQLFDIYTSTGEFRRSVEFPLAFDRSLGKIVPAHFDDSVVVGVIRDPATDVQQVAILRLPE